MYRQLGNSVAVSVIEAIAHTMKALIGKNTNLCQKQVISPQN